MTTRSGLLACAVLAALALAVPPAGAQSLSTPTFVNQSNPDELFTGSTTVPSFERESATELVSSAGGGFVTRYISLVTADGDGASASGLGESLFSDYTLNFTATAPGAYVLTVTTELKGDMNLVNDSPHAASADVGAVTGILQSGGTLTSGTLNLPDPGSTSGSLGVSNAFDAIDSASIFAVSNGAPVAHSLRFQFFQLATTDASGGDEAAVRLGDTSHVSSEAAGDYPGSPSRIQTGDGHFVTVTMTSLCGNGTLDSGPSYAEDCDDGPQNGQPGSCCSASCTFVPPSTPCDDGDACTLGETCTSGVCGGGLAQTCPLCQTCDSMGGCVDGPRANCKITTAPLKAKFQLKSSANPAANLVSYKWLKGEATATAEFGDPTTSDDYALCVFTPGLALKTTAPAGGLCGTKACWKALSIKGFAYKDALRTPDGVDKITLKAGLVGKAKTQLKGKGPTLPALPLPLTLPATVQLQSETAGCWEATFSSAGQIQNDATGFKGKAD